MKAGQLLLEYDKDSIARSGYSLETQVVVTNSEDYSKSSLQNLYKILC